MSSFHEIFIGSDDAQALDRLLSDHSLRDESSDAALELANKLFEAQVVAPAALPHGTVRLNSTVTYEELPEGRLRQVRLVNPREADAGAGRISVLSPVGRGLLGQSLGRVVELVLPTGRRQRVRVAAVAAARSDRLAEPAFG